MSTTTTKRDRTRTRMQWTLGLMALVPTISGAQQVLLGADAVPGNISEVSAEIAGELRYANVFKAAVGPIILSRLGTVEDSTAVTAAWGRCSLGGWHVCGRGGRPDVRTASESLQSCSRLASYL
jgi:hypothetical protein